MCIFRNLLTELAVLLLYQKTLRKTFVGKLPAVKSFPSEPEGDIPPLNDDNKPLIVVCLHPLQAYFVSSLPLLASHCFCVYLVGEDRFDIEINITVVLYFKEDINQK